MTSLSSLSTSLRGKTSVNLFETLSADRLLDKLPQPSGTSTESTEVSQAESQSESELMASTTSGPDTTELTRTLYNAGLILKKLLSDFPAFPKWLVIMKKMTLGCFYMYSMLHKNIKLLSSKVAVIAVSLQRDLQCRLYFFTGVGNRTRIIDVAKVSTALGTSVCEHQCLSWQGQKKNIFCCLSERRISD